MASSQTANYQLNQWAASDQFLRTEFNADNSKIDAALQSLQGQHNTSRPHFVTYTGDGTTTREIDVGTEGKMALIMGMDDNTFGIGAMVSTYSAIYWERGYTSDAFTPMIRLSGTKLVFGGNAALNASGGIYSCIIFSA